MKSYLAAVAALTLLGACSVADQSAQNQSSDDTETPTLTVLTHDSFALSDEAIARFETDYGYKLQTTSPGDAGTVLSQLVLTKDNPTADAVYGLDNYSIDQAQAESVIETPTPIDQGDVCINTDHAFFTEAGIAEPQTLEDLTKPEYKDMLVVTNPVESSPGFAFLSGTAEQFGDDWTSYWESLQENGVKIVDSWSTAYYSEFTAGGEDGTYPLVLSYSSSPAETEGATGIVPGSCVRQIEYAAPISGTANMEGAQAFIDFLRSPETQTEIPEQMYMYPVTEGVDLPESWAEFAPLPENSIEPIVDREALLNEWTAWYEG